MSLITEFKSSLKSVDTEEIIDLIVFRPVSFVFVKLIYGTNITPNQISIVALIFGVLAGVFYGFPSYTFALLGSASFFMCNMLDCADGQLARLKKNGTKTGRIIDGLIDYISNLAVLLGIGIALSHYTPNPLFIWLLLVAVGLSKAAQNMFFDNFRNSYLKYVYNKVSGVNEEIEEFREERGRLEKENGSGFEKWLVDIYIGYSVFQKKFTKNTELNVTPEEYKSKNKLILRMWSWIGTTTHLSVLIFFSLFNRLDLYLLTIITIGNVMLIILFLWQKSIIKNLEKK